ncbi:hypothetical protein M0802_010847 [Mischocyttarus mexicanus]|nr:hypothetical protein M0802_010847 [Mischocyttarus mexicanus]
MQYLIHIFTKWVKKNAREINYTKKNPTGLLSVKDFDELEDCTDVDKVEALEKVYEEVQSSVIEEKLSGLHTLESMSYGKGMAERISRNGIVKMIGPLLLDHSTTIRASAASTLRHIAENGKDNVIKKFIDDDIMTPLCTLFIKKYDKWTPTMDPAVKETLRDVRETFIEAITLLLILCENSKAAVIHVNETDLFLILIPYLDFTIYGIEMSIATAQFMLTLSEDNNIGTELISCTDYLTILNLSPTDQSFCDLILLKTLIIGIMHNLYYFSNAACLPVFEMVIVDLLEALDIDNNNLSHELREMLLKEKGNLSKETQKKIREFRKLLGAQQQTLEILTNLCAEEEREWFPSLYKSNDEESMDEDKSEEINLSYISLPVEMIKTIADYNIIQKVWIKTADIDKEIRELFSNSVEGRTILEQIHVLRCRAYLCAHNLLSVLDTSSTNDVEDMYNKWCQTGIFVFQEVDKNDFELLESASALLGTCLQKLATSENNYFSNLTVDDIKPILQWNKPCLNENFGVNVIRILGNLTLIIAQTDNQHKHDLMKHISVFLLVTCKNESSAWVNAECLDALMDIFSNDETDQLAAEIRLTVQLSELVSVFKEKVRQQKRLLKDKMKIISTVNENITRFIEYKENRLKLLK